MKDALLHTARIFRRALVMPNLRPPVRTVDDAAAYRQRILAALPENLDFLPLMSLYLTDQTGIPDIRAAAGSGIVAAAKLYPAGATTNSASGVTDIRKMDPVFDEMTRLKLPLLVHAEVTDPRVDIFDREKIFIETVLAPLAGRHPGLRLVLEHASTRDALTFVRGARPGVAATITAHHLLLSRNDIFRDGLNPHHYCLPIVKTEADRQALIEAATSGDPRFFAGTDSAPHPRKAKEQTGGAAGIFSAPAAVSLYAGVFEEAGALEKLEAFLSLNGAAFYGLAPNEERIRLRRTPMRVPDEVGFGDATAVPLGAGRKLPWRPVMETGASGKEVNR